MMPIKKVQNHSYRSSVKKAGYKAGHRADLIGQVQISVVINQGYYSSL